MTIVIFGGNGFVGRNVANVFRQHHLNFVTASRSDKQVDLRNPLQTADFLTAHQPDVIVNCAAHVGSLHYVTEQAADVIMDNSRMILGMYEAIAKACPKATVINPIANCAYPDTANTFVEDKWWDGHLHRSVLSYGATKRLLWATAESFSMQHDIRSIHLLVSNMYGPYDSADPNKAHALNALVSKFVKALHEGKEELMIWGTGIAIREWLYAEDFGRIVYQIICNPNMPGLAEPTNIAQNFGLSVKELSNLIQAQASKPIRIRWDPDKPDGMPKKVMDDRKFRKVFPNFEFTSLEHGIMETFAYYESIYPF